MRLLALCSVPFALALGCSDPHAQIEVTGVRTWRAPDAHVVVDVDFVASEALGGNIGMYCTRATFPWQKEPAETCKADLEDGDTATVRLVSNAWLPKGALITVRVRHAATDQTRTVVAPP